jgi:hypothetical protein
MKTSLPLKAVVVMILTTLLCFLETGCKKDESLVTHIPGNEYSGDVVRSWIKLQLKLTRNTPASVLNFGRIYAYIGISLYESVVPGLLGYQSLAQQIKSLPVLPAADFSERYYWPASANAAMAVMSRKFFSAASASNKASIDSLEAANKAIYSENASSDVLTRSIDFGKQVAAIIFEWSKTDGSDYNAPYTPPVGPGLWQPTPPLFMPASFPYWGNSRLIVPESGNGVENYVPEEFSENPVSAYYGLAKEIYNVCQSLTDDQKALALFWADNSDGKSYTATGHWLSILNQVLEMKDTKLSVAAAAYAQLGISLYDAGVNCWKIKYRINGARPVTYIRTILNHPNWLPFLVNTPPHPEFPSGHATLSGAAAQTMTHLFGENFKFTDSSYVDVGLPARSFDSFEKAAIEAGDSRAYGGIHYFETADLSHSLGKVVADNIHNRLKFNIDS